MTSRFLAALAACVLVAACAEAPRQAISSSSYQAAQSQALSFAEVQARVEPVAEAECARRNPGANCNFRIVVDDRPGMPPNAFQTLDANGRPLLAVTAALLRQMRNNDELALVMAHEASHHIAGHLARQNEYAYAGAAAYGEAASQAQGATAASVRRAQAEGAQRTVRQYTRNWEIEADQLGAMVAARAGYDPVRGAEFFRRLPDPGHRPNGTHPSNAERIAAIHAAAR